MSTPASTELLPFTTHRIELAPGDWTMGPEGDDAMTNLRTRSMLDAGGVEGKRVIDLGCLEGGYTAAFARLGAESALGVEARQINFRRCEMVRRTLDLPNLRFEHADVRDVSADSHGQFEVVFAAGILYHLDDPFQFLESIAGMCTELAVIDTHVAGVESRHCPERDVRQYRGRDYEGGRLVEYEPDLPEHEVEEAIWSAYGNPNSFWLRKEDLVSILGDLGFGRVMQVPTPLPYHCGLQCETECRVLLLAEKESS